MTQLVGRSIGDLRKLLASRQVSAREIAEAHFKHIEAVEPAIQSFNLVLQELALKQASAVDAAIAKGDTPPLAGVPVAIKDNICVKDYPTTCSSKILANYVSPYDATVAEKLQAAGAIVVGKTNLDEFAMGSSTENSAFKLTRNPWDVARVPGGSSGGSAAAVASGQAVVSLGSDTGGSIRLPAAFCGVVGMKPTYGLVSRFGLVAFASSLDQVGPFGRTVEDVAQTMAVICGHDPRDSTSLPASRYPDLLSGLDEPVHGMRIGVIKELMSEGIDPEVSRSVAEASKVFAGLGATIEEVTLPSLKHVLPVYYLITSAEASANLARYDGVKYGYRSPNSPDMSSLYYNSRKEGFGAEVKRRIMLGTYALASGYYDAYYKKAQQVRRIIKDALEKAFARCDILLCPTGPTVAFEFGAKTADPLQMYLTDIATIPANLAGTPGISLPCGLSGNGLPIGLQLLGPALGDATILKAARAFEKSATPTPCPMLAQAAVTK